MYRKNLDRSFPHCAYWETKRGNVKGFVVWIVHLKFRTWTAMRIRINVSIDVKKTVFRFFLNPLLFIFLILKMLSPQCTFQFIRYCMTYAIIRYAKACRNYTCFLCSARLIKIRLLEYGYVPTRLKSLLQKCYSHRELFLGLFICFCFFLWIFFGYFILCMCVYFCLIFILWIEYVLYISARI